MNEQYGKDNYKKILPFMDMKQRKDICPLIITLIMFENSNKYLNINQWIRGIYLKIDKKLTILLLS